MEAPDTLSDGLDMDPIMMSGFMKTSWAMPEVSWSSTSKPMGLPDCYANIIYCTWPLYAYRAQDSLQTKVPTLIWCSRVAWESPWKLVVYCCWACIDWSPTGGSSVLQGTVYKQGAGLKHPQLYNQDIH